MTQDEKDMLLALFGDEERWCQHAEARDGKGHAVHYSDETATAWDVVGGMCHLFGWERACELFMHVGRHVTGLEQSPEIQDGEIAAMAALQDFNDKRSTKYELIIARLRNMPLQGGRLSPALRKCRTA